MVWRAIVADQTSESFHHKGEVPAFEGVLGRGKQKCSELEPHLCLFVHHQENQLQEGRQLALSVQKGPNRAISLSSCASLPPKPLSNSISQPRLDLPLSVGSGLGGHLGKVDTGRSC